MDELLQNMLLAREALETALEHAASALATPIGAQVPLEHRLPAALLCGGIADLIMLINESMED